MQVPATPTKIIALQQNRTDSGFILVIQMGCIRLLAMDSGTAMIHKCYLIRMAYFTERKVTESLQIVSTYPKQMKRDKHT